MTENIELIPEALNGASFHGETWVKCPYCKKAHEISTWYPKITKNGYGVYKCSCGESFKVKM